MSASHLPRPDLLSLPLAEPLFLSPRPATPPYRRPFSLFFPSFSPDRGLRETLTGDGTSRDGSGGKGTVHGYLKVRRRFPVTSNVSTPLLVGVSCIPEGAREVLEAGVGVGS